MLKNTQKHILWKSLGVSCLLQWMSMILKMPHYFQGKGEHLKGVTFSEDLVSYFGYFTVFSQKRPKAKHFRSLGPFYKGL